VSDERAVTEVYYDPYDMGIDDNPYPVWKRLRDEAPLYRNEEHNFYALSRWDDVEPALGDHDTYRSGRGTILDIIRIGMDIPPGIILFEDPPIHDVHRRLLARVFTPRRMTDIEPLVRQFCAKALDPFIGTDEFDAIGDFGAFVPMRTIGFLLGIPEEDQEAIRKFTDDTITIQDGKPAEYNADSFNGTNDMVAEYIDWRADHPSNDLMTDLLNAEVEEDGVHRRLTRTEAVTYTNVIVGAGNETATRLIGFALQLLAENPDQRKEIVANPSLIRPSIEEVLRYEAPSPVQARYLAHDVKIHDEVLSEDSIVLLLNGSANRDERHFEDADRFDIHRPPGLHLSFGYGLHFCLGAALARLEARVALEEILKRWPEWEIDYGRANKAHTGSVRGWASLPLQTR
jgi:cytochrome P450